MRRGECQLVDLHVNEIRKLGGRENVRLVAQTVTKALRSTCRQLKEAAVELLLKLANKLGQAGFATPVNAAAALARRMGIYKLAATHDMYVNDPERS